MRWTADKANEWSDKTGWLCGFNYVPSTAVNSSEMWQNEFYDGETIKRELAIAVQIGFNSCRVFLQYLVWEAERDIFLETFGDFCGIAKSNGITVMPVLFDDCAFSGREPYLGEQEPPVPGVHNSGWTPSPGPRIADDPSKEEGLREYVKTIIGAHKKDGRITAWDLYNEPGNNNRGEKCLPLVNKAFAWAREISPVQPLTAGVWSYAGYDLTFADMSDVVSYHDYALPGTNADGFDPAESSEKTIETLKKHGRPLLCTEWLHRPLGNRFETHLPLFKKENVGSFHWGLITGKTQTNLCWETMNGNPDPSPAVWQHDLFYPDGRPYRGDEVLFIKRIFGKPGGK